MTKIIERNVAELIIIALVTIVLMTSCGTAKQVEECCGGKAIHTEEEYYELLAQESENCDEID